MGRMKHFFILLLTVLEIITVADGGGPWDSGASTTRCPLVRFPNGKARSRGRGKIIRFSCIEGYTLVGNKYSTCIRGNWDTPTPVCVNSQCMTLPTPDHALVAAKYNGAILMYFCEPGYMLIGNSEIYCNGKQWNGTAPYCRDTTARAPTKCDFENVDLCWWEQDPHHDFDWRRQNFETPSSHIGTGPTHDHTLGPGRDGYYLYIEASGRLVNDTARIISPLYNASLANFACFSFWYHMYGATIGRLRVYFKPEFHEPEQIFEKKGNQGNRWIHGLARLPEYSLNFQLIIEGVRGSSYVSDLAIDDVAILQKDECNKAIDIDRKIAADRRSTTISDNDQIEIVNALQSCRGRCDITMSGGALLLPDACLCSIDCAENSMCCPDFAEYCILAINDTTTATTSSYSLSSMKIINLGSGDTTQHLPTTQPTKINTKIIDIPIDPSINSSRLPKDDIDPYAVKPPLRLSTPKNTIYIQDAITAVTTSATMKKKIIKYSIIPDNGGGIMATEKIIPAETPFVTRIDNHQITTAVNLLSSIQTTAINRDREYTTGKEIVKDHVQQQLHHMEAASTFGTTEIISGIVVLITVITIIVGITIFALRRRKAYCKRGSAAGGSGNGSILSEDSDVRFLTSDEILDFNLARPSEYEEF